MLETLATAEFMLAAALLLLAIVVAPYYAIQWPGGGWVGAAILIALGMALAWLMVRHVTQRIGATITAHLGGQWHLTLIVGAVLQVGAAAITAPVPTSDFRMYLLLAEGLASGVGYVDDAGRLAFMPPGMPFVLTPFVWMFGANLVAVTAVNVVLFLLGALALWSIAFRLFGRSVANVSVALYTIWPTRILSAGLPAKETLTLAMLLVGAALSLKALSETERRPWAAGVAAGAAYGLASLAQPGFLLFLLTIPIAFRFAARSLGVTEFVTRIGVIMVGAMLCIVPWVLRNNMIFEGEFVGVATNGGSVFYRANNPRATGEWAAEGEIPITHLPELEQNKLGFALGREWIKSHPLDMLRLSLRKVTYLLASDDDGPYWGIFRGTGRNHDDSRRLNSSGRIAAFELASLASLVFWILFAAWGASALLALRSHRDPSAERLLPLIYPLLYSACVFSIFESGTRQHIAAAGPLFALAAFACHGSLNRVAQPARTRGLS